MKMFKTKRTRIVMAMVLSLVLTLGLFSGIALDAYASVDSFTFKFDGNGATSGNTEPLEIARDQGEVVIPDCGFQRENATFLGWGTTSSSVFYNAGSRIDDADAFLNMLDTNEKTLYAVWRIDACTITFDGNGATSGNTDQLVISRGQAAVVPECGFQKENATFIGWGRDRNNVLWNAGNHVNNDGFLDLNQITEMTLYAIWREDAPSNTNDNTDNDNTNNVAQSTIAGTGDVAPTLVFDATSAPNVPADATFSANKVTSGEVYEQAQSIVSSEYAGSKFDVFDFSLKNATGVEIHDLGGYVEVKMDPPAGLTEQELQQYKVFAVVNGKLEACETRYENGKIVFKTNHFSTYVGVVVPADKLAESNATAQTGATVSSTSTTKVSAPKTADVIPFIGIAIVFVGILTVGITFVVSKRS